MRVYTDKTTIRRYVGKSIRIKTAAHRLNRSDRLWLDMRLSICETAVVQIRMVVVKT